MWGTLIKETTGPSLTEIYVACLLNLPAAASITTSEQLAVLRRRSRALAASSCEKKLILLARYQ